MAFSLAAKIHCGRYGSARPRSSATHHICPNPWAAGSKVHRKLETAYAQAPTFSCWRAQHNNALSTRLLVPYAPLACYPCPPTSPRSVSFCLRRKCIKGDSKPKGPCYNSRERVATPSADVASMAWRAAASNGTAASSSFCPRARGPHRTAPPRHHLLSARARCWLKKRSRA